MALKWIPKIEYNATTLTLTEPQKLWTPSAKPHGGSAVSDAGVPEAFIIRRDYRAKVVLRFNQTEWAAMDAWIDWGQSGQSFDFWFDKDLIATKYTCYLESPMMGDGEVEPVRESYRYIYSIECILRTTNGTIFDVRV
jgi:hypothetical protein